MKIDDLKKEDLYGDWNMTRKKAFDCAKSDLSAIRTSEPVSGPVAEKAKGPKWLEGLKTLLTTAAIILLLLALLTPFDYINWLVAVCPGAAALVIHLIQQHIKRT